MNEIAPATKKPKNFRKIALSISLSVAGLGAIAGGAFATFTSSATQGPQAITTGTVKIAVGPVTDLATGATNIAAGDTLNREADLNSTGATIPDASISLKIAASPTSLLDTDATNGLQVSARACALAPVRTAGPPLSYTCGGGWITLNIGGSATASVSALEASALNLTALNSIAISSQDYIVWTLTLPSTSPGDTGQHAACSGTPGGTVTTENLEGCSSTLTYTFTATQRTGAAQ